MKQRLKQILPYPWRTGRILRRLWQIALSIWLLLLLLVACTIQLNRTTLTLQYAMTGPDVPPDVQSLHTHDGRLVAGTLGGGVFRWQEQAQQWIPLNQGLSNIDVRSLHTHDGQLLARTWDGGIFLWNQQTQLWRPINQGLSDTDVRSLHTHDGRLLAGTADGGIFQWNQQTQLWRPINQGLPDTDVRSLHTQDGRLVAGTWGGGIFQWQEQTQQWIPLNQGLSDTNVRSLHTHDGHFFAGTDGGGLFRWNQQTQQWQATTISGYNVSDGSIMQLDQDYGLIQSGNQLVWLTPDKNTSWATSNLAGRVIIHSTSPPEVWAAWGAMITKAPLTPSTSPTQWIEWRLWLWQWTPWLKSQLWLTGVGVLIALLIVNGLDFINVARPFKLPLWGVRLARQPEYYADSAALNREWPQWKSQIRAELLQYGDVEAVDLRAVPSPFRGYSRIKMRCKTYLTTYQTWSARILFLLLNYNFDRLFGWRAKQPILAIKIKF